MFNDRYGLTQAVIDGRKTMTRRLINPMPEDCTANHKNYWGLIGRMSLWLWR